MKGKKSENIVVFDPRREYQIDVIRLHPKGKNTPFDGWEEWRSLLYISRRKDRIRK